MHIQSFLYLGISYVRNEFAVVVAQLVEWSLPIPEVRSLNPVISKKLFILNICLLCIEKTKIKKKRPGMGHIL